MKGKVVIDSSGDALQTEIRSKAYLIKPNIEVVQEWYCKRFRALGEEVFAAKAPGSAGVESLLVSLDENGAT